MADTYTIQFRRGMYTDFDTSKIRPGNLLQSLVMTRPFHPVKPYTLRLQLMM